MTDLFDEFVSCNKCGKKMSKVLLIKNGFKIRALKCEHCEKIIEHPSDLEEYKKFLSLRQKPFEVKLRIVGNSYAISIPKEIIDFHQEQERMHQRFVKIQNEMVKMFLEDVGRISLSFPNFEEKQEKKVIKVKNKNE